MALVPAADFTRIRDGARRFASGFTRGQKTATVLSLVGLVAAGIIFMSITSKPTYSILFTNLKATDAASITSELTSDHVPYQLQDGGATILVPENDVDQQRLVAAEAGLPASQSTQGLSILDKEGLTTSQLTQQADYLQAIQGELEQTIDSITGVATSTVTVAMPANQTFALGSTNPTGASVLVGLENGSSLTSEEVSAIVSLVSSSVPGLTSSEVTVVDSNGDLLAGPGVSDDGQDSSAATAYDEETQAKVVSYLTSVLGSDNADVQVNADLNFNQVKTTYQSLVTGPSGKVVSACTSTDKSTTKYTGANAGSQVSATAGTSGNGTYTQTSNNQSCESGTENQTVVQAPGSVTRQSVAVLVNSLALPKGVNTNSLQQGVSAAAGIETSRGDVLSFSAVPFAVSTTGATKAAKASMLTSFAKPGLAVLLVLLMLFMLWRTSRKAKKNTVPASALDNYAYDPFALGYGTDPITAELPAVGASALPSSTFSVHDIVEAQPEEVATVLRDWLQHSHS